MRVGILDLDTKKEKMGHGKPEKFPNLACGQIYGYHVQNGDEVVYPWHGERVDRLYVSAIFSWTKPAIERHLPLWQKVAGGGTHWWYRVGLEKHSSA